MSDGPHRTLGMPKGWRKVAECAFREASSTEEVSDLFPSAISDDWRREVASELVIALQAEFGDGRKGCLFSGEELERVGALRRLATGFPLACLLIDCAETVAAEGLNGQAALLEVVRRAIGSWIPRLLRQIEEHHLRETDGKSAVDVRGRLGAAANALDHSKLAAQLLRADPTPIERRPPKHAGLDDGPRL